LPGKESFTIPYQELARDRFLLGSPDDTVREIERYRETLGINCLIFRMQWPGMDHRQVMRQIELIAREVIPRVKAVA
jgi:alkanesulfonate monooxygenase SsuD/methylene tetrahydromethanopterin reductase-like flavin-dependent oxidoreductase (luciferase family)